jgi:hypothetical protein
MEKELTQITRRAGIAAALVPVFAAYLSASFIGVLSFHAVDVVRGMTWHGLSPVDVARGAGALVSLFATVFALRRKNGTRPG